MTYIPERPPGLVTLEMFGHETDFLFEQNYDEKTGSIMLKVSTMMPVLARNPEGQIASFAPPRYPWNGSRITALAQHNDESTNAMGFFDKLAADVSKGLGIPPSVLKEPKP